MKDLVLTINELPVGLNKMKRLHWTVYGEKRDLWRILVRAAIGRQLCSFPGRVAVEYVVYRVQLADKDNHHASFKLIGDALVHYGVIRDDGPEIIDEDLSKYRQEQVRHRSEQHIMVRIKDLEAPT